MTEKLNEIKVFKPNYRFANGSCYIGEWSGPFIHGYGTRVYINNSFYSG